MIISARIVKPGAKARRCEHCGAAIYGNALWLYGAAHHGDKPYVIWIHPECTDFQDPTILRAKGEPVL